METVSTWVCGKVYAEIQALQAGGNAATTALTKVTMQSGSIVSCAGIFKMLCYDAKGHKVYSMDAGYNSYLPDTDPNQGVLGRAHPVGPGGTNKGA
jgi:hypothetical protein